MAEAGAASAPTSTLGALWWFVMAAPGVIFPYYALYLRENAGLSGTEVGIVVAMLPLVGLFAQPFWGQVADRTGRRSHVLVLLAGGSTLGYVALSACEGFPAFVLATAGLALCSTALIPSCVAVSLALLPDRTGRGLGRVRSLGTLGFAASVLLFPHALRALRGDTFSLVAETPAGEPGLQLMFSIAAANVLIAAGIAARLPEAGGRHLRAARGEWRGLLENHAFVRVLGFVLLTYLFMQGPMVLFPILVRAQGGGLDAISHMWGLMLILEVPLIFHLGAGITRFGPRGVIAIGVAAAALRWGVSGFAEDLRWVYAAQLLHGVTVWGLIMGAPIYVDAVVPPRLRSTGQGLLAMIGVSLGSILSNLAAGYLTEAFDARAPARIAAVASCVLVLALPFVLPKPLYRLEDVEAESDTGRVS